MRKLFVFEVVFLFNMLMVCAQNKADTIEINNFNDTLVSKDISKLELSNFKDSILILNELIAESVMKNEYLEFKLLSKIRATDSLKSMLKEKEKELYDLTKILEGKNDLLQQHIGLLSEKERIFIEKENLYIAAIYNSKIDSVELMGKIKTQNALLEGKVEKILLLQKQISDKEKHIDKKESQIAQINEQRESDLSKIDSLNKQIDQNNQRISELDKELAVKKLKYENLQNENKHLVKQLDLCKNSAKRKKIRLVQGIAFNAYRTPNYELTPVNAKNSAQYEIHNKNKGNLEIDYVTGVSLKFVPIFTAKNEYANDLGVFIGFGGKELFKNFYFGPNVKLFNAFHINTGVNVREYEILKEGFNEGDILATGTDIPTDNEWKINWYAALTFDFSLIADVAKKL